jgi:alpha-amylase
MQVSADVAGSSFYEVTFYAKVGNGNWQPIGTDDTAPYRVFHDVSGLAPGTGVRYRAVVLDNDQHTSTSGTRTTTVPPPALTIEAPAEGSGVRGTVEVRASADPERATHVVSFERSVSGGTWTPIGTDSSSPAYTVFDDLMPLNLAAGTPVAYRAKLVEPNGSTVISAPRTVHAAGPPAAVATLHYFRPAGDYTDWGPHLWGTGVDPAALAQIRWDRPWPLTRVKAGWAEYDIPLVDDATPVNFIMHLPNGDEVPNTREPGGDRSFLPIDTPNVWIKQGDPTVYTSPPPT